MDSSSYPVHRCKRPDETTDRSDDVSRVMFNLDNRLAQLPRCSADFRGLRDRSCLSSTRVIGVSSQGHINQPVKVRPRLRDSSRVAWEASWSESETMKPSDNMLRKEYAQLTRLQRTVNADVASL